ncbi:MAG: hypothetical protein AB1847_18300 [bacterium]
MDTVNDFCIARLKPFDSTTASRYIEAVFSSRQIELKHEVRDTILELVGTPIPYLLSDAKALYAPYMIALEYLQSGRDPAVMERQQPEMREAIQLLVDAFTIGIG